MKSSKVKLPKHRNNCPKADRCAKTKEFICDDVFRGEYICFESNSYNEYLNRQNESLNFNTGGNGNGTNTG